VETKTVETEDVSEPPLLPFLLQAVETETAETEDISEPLLLLHGLDSVLY
jgi:hypothetical protein